MMRSMSHSEIESNPPRWTPREPWLGAWIFVALLLAVTSLSVLSHVTHSGTVSDAAAMTDDTIQIF